MSQTSASVMAGSLWVMWVCGTCWASGRQVEAERFLPPSLLRVDSSSASLEFIYSHDEGTRGNNLYGPVVDRSLDSYDTRMNIAMNGSIYHPYLLEFSVSGAIGYVEDTGMTGTRGQADSREDLGARSNVREYNVDLSFLKSTPYSVRLFANRSINHFDSDFFTRLTSDGQSRGITGQVRSKWVPLTWSYSESISDTWGLSTSYHNEDETFSAQLVDRRDRGESRLNYLHQHFLRDVDSRVVNDGVQQQAAFSDRRIFGTSGDGALNNLVRYSSQDGIRTSFQSLSLDEDVFYRFGEVWSTSASYGYSKYDTDGSESRSHRAGASVSHQLFKSLTSAVSIDGNVDDSDGYLAKRFGAGISETYTKQLGSSSRLDLGVRHHESWEDRVSSGQSTGSWRESISIRNNTTTFLGVAGVDLASVEVRDEQEITIYNGGFDYELIPVGGRTQIRRLVGGRIADGATVVVTYRATSGGDERFRTSDDNVSSRLHLLNNHLELFAGFSSYRVNGDLSSAVAQGTEKNVGASGFWGFLSGGIDYSDSSLTLSRYKRINAYESLQFTPFARSQLGINFQQSQTDYEENEGVLKTSSEVATLDSMVWRDTTLRISAGHYSENRLNDESDYLTMSANLAALVGKLQIALGYDYRETLKNGDEDVAHYLTLRIRRSL